jgi:hypothetical protein
MEKQSMNTEKDRRRKTPAQKAKTQAARLARADTHRRQQRWTAAALAASAAGYPLNFMLTVTWPKIEDGDRRRGHILAKKIVEREAHLWSELRQVAVRARVEWVAARAPEFDKTHGQHLHIAGHLPNDAALKDAMNVVEHLTGAPAMWCDMRGRTLRGGGRISQGCVAMSANGGWLLQRHMATAGGSGFTLATYAAKGTGKAKVEGQHRLSNALLALLRESAAEGTATARAA